MIISESFCMFAIIAIACISAFIVFILKQEIIKPIHKVYCLFGVFLDIWFAAILGMRFVSETDETTLFWLDAITNFAGPASTVCYLIIVLAFLYKWDSFPKKISLLTLFPAVNALIVCTNPYHHLHYEAFSIRRSELVFGPYAAISGIIAYVHIAIALVLLVKFMSKTANRLYFQQASLLFMGGLAPVAVSLIATTTTLLPITATPMSFSVTLILNGIAIYSLHILDIKPIATELILESISDSYMILSENKVVVSYNKLFAHLFIDRYGFKEGKELTYDFTDDDNISNSLVYNLISAVDSCKESNTTIFYEQSLTIKGEDGARIKYYIAEISPVQKSRKNVGYVVIFKDVTQIKESMKRLQDNQTRMVQQERLAFLGQMIGGMAHNLKTPIMSISGCLSSVESLVEECTLSLDDNLVTKEDFIEMHSEINDWCYKMRESTTYMSDIITAIKGQAATAVSPKEAVFTIDELFKRVVLLMRHELFLHNNYLTVEYNNERDTEINGDINVIIQTLDNFISNAIFAKKENGEIVLGVNRNEENLQIYVKDYGCGVTNEVKSRLFKEMITSKGTHGTGLGLYISQVVIHGSFEGNIWHEDNPDGGSVFGVDIPLTRIVEI